MTPISDDDIRHDEYGRARHLRGSFSLPPEAADAGELGDRVKSFLEAHADQLDLADPELGLEVVDVVDTPTVASTRLRQVHDGVPVYGSEVLVITSRDERVNQVNLNQVVGLTVATPEERDRALSTRRATTAAKNAIGVTPATDPTVAEKVYFPVGDELRLAFRVVIETIEPDHEWEVLVDAYSGEELQRRDLLMHVDGEGLVFDPNPVVTANDNTLRDPNAAGACGFAGSPLATIEAERVTRTLRDLSASGGVHHLDGPFVRIADFMAGSATPPIEANADDFNYSSNTADFDAVNVYYHVDTVQRYLQSLGITTAHPNVIEADVRVNQTGASYSPTNDHMRFGDSGQCRPERASDGDVALHEYGHAIQHSQVPTWGGVSPVTGRNETRAMGEGFGDILACVFFAEHGGGFQREVFEDWIFGDVGGLRRVDGTKVYPTDWANQVHQDGEIWSAALWNIYRAIGGDSVVQANRLAARDELLKTVVLSHHRVMGNATMPDGAEAFMDENADLRDFRLVNGVDILDSFHDRGLLSCGEDTDLRFESLWSQQVEAPVGSWQQVEAGQDNWFYAEVKNYGTETARAFVVLFSFKSPFASPIYPTDFRDNIIAGAVGYDLAPGATTTVKARWPDELIPPIPAGATKRHGCILAEVYTPCDHVAPGVTNIGGSNGKLKQRNTDIVDLVPGDTMDYFIDLGNFAIQRPELVRLEVIRDPKFPAAPVKFTHRDPRFLEELVRNVEFTVPERIDPGLVDPGRFDPGRFDPGSFINSTRVRVLDPTRIRLDPVGAARSGALSGLVFDLAAGSAVEFAPAAEGGAAEGDAVADADFVRSDAEFVRTASGAELLMRAGTRVGFPFRLEPRKRAVVKMQISAPRDARPGDQFTTQFVQRNTRGELIGEWDITVRVVERR